MKIHIPCDSNQSIGGGFTFHRNLSEALAADYPNVQLVKGADPHDILFAFSVTTVDPETISRSKVLGAKFVLRIDGVPEDSRNSGKGTRRLVEFSRMADVIIYQSQFVKRTIGMLLRASRTEHHEVVIPNGVNLSIFSPQGERLLLDGNPIILHIAYRKDPNKRYEEVVAMYREYFARKPEANLILLGRYPSEWQNYNMGFFSGERWKRLGVMEDSEAKATAMRSCDFLFYPSFADPAPNAVLEAMACGLPVLYQPYGGVEEMVGNGHAGLAIDYTKGFTEQIEELLDDRMQFSEIARKQAEKHSLGAMASRYVHVWEQVLSQ
jgi:glycosyltransferase involved in cell wall biosynthesis